MLAERVKEWTEEWKRQGLQEGLQQGLQQGRQQGRQEGRQEGLRQGEAAVLMRLAERKFGPLSEANRRRIDEADSDTLLRWSERILSAQTLDEVFAEA